MDNELLFCAEGMVLVYRAINGISNSLPSFCGLMETYRCMFHSNKCSRDKQMFPINLCTHKSYRMIFQFNSLNPPRLMLPAIAKRGFTKPRQCCTRLFQ